jgi:hypothetical protein
MENTNNNQNNQNSQNNQIDSAQILNELAQTSKETLKKAVNLKVEEIIKDSVEIVTEYTGTNKDSFSELEITLTRKIALFSIKEIEKSLPKESFDPSILTNNSEKVFLDNVLYFWNQVIEEIKVWKPIN